MVLDGRLAQQLVNAALEAMFLTPGAMLAWWADCARSLPFRADNQATPSIVADSEWGGLTLPTSSPEAASDLPESGVEVIVSLPETGTHALGLVDCIDASNRAFSPILDEDRRTRT